MRSSPYDVNPSLDRYKRIRQLGWNPEVLSRAHILVVGAGALGNEVLKNLALLGVGWISIIDMDFIEDHNLARSVLFCVQDIGKPKAAIAAHRVMEINPDSHAHALIGSVQNVLGLGAYQYFDVVLGCLDNGQARYDVGRACWQTRRLFIDSGLDHLNGDVRVFQSPDTACYACTLSESGRQTLGNRHRCLQVRIGGELPIIPTAPTISSIAAGWQTQIAIKFLHDMPIPSGKRLGLYGLTDETFVYKMSPNPDCIAQGEHALIPQENIISSDLSIATCTAKALLEFAINKEPRLTDKAVIDLGFDFVKFAECSKCRQKKSIYNRKDQIYIDEVTCCGETMSLEETYLVARQDELANMTLADLMVPPLDLVTVKYTNSPNQTEWIYQSVKLGGDLKTVFGDVFLEHLKSNRGENL